jgi:hypothetical protein
MNVSRAFEFPSFSCVDRREESGERERERERERDFENIIYIYSENIEFFHSLYIYIYSVTLLTIVRGSTFYVENNFCDIFF